MGSVFASALTARDEIELMIAGSGPGRADRLAAAVGAVPCDSAAHLSAAVDGVVVAAATPAHAGLVRLGIGARIPVFCEKPLTLDLATTDELIAEAAEAGVEIQVGMQRRFDSEYLAARRAVQSGEVGDVYLVRTASHDALPGGREFIGESGSVERDLLIHDFDITRFVTGQEITDVVSMTASGRFPALVHYEEHDDAGTIAGVIRLDGGGLGVVTGLRHHPAGQDVRMEVHGSRGSAVVGWGAGSPFGGAGADPHRSFLDRFGGAFAAEMEAFADFVAGHRPNPCPAEDARRSLAVAAAAERSRLEQRPVAVAEVG
jgi:myo-inositol 2-dehydrogenase/D-chiro-inositol 1-dehydrogenase